MSSLLALQSREKLLQMIRRMLAIRHFEERVVKEFAERRIYGFVHVYIGEEAVAVGVCSAIRDDDYIISTHRGHGHCIAKGVSIKGMMAELFGRRTGICKGKGGSMHIADLTLNMLGANGIVGGGIPISNGAALSAKYRGTDQVTVCFFGDGAINQGGFHESLNLASIWKLPTIFVCENNQYAETTPPSYATNIKDLAFRADSYGIPGVKVDGMDATAVYQAASDAVARARRGDGPTLLVCETYRYRGHYEGDDQTYRTDKDVEEWRKKDSILKFKNRLIEHSLLTEEEYEEIDRAVLNEVDEAVEYADASKWPSPDEALEDVYTSL